MEIDCKEQHKLSNGVVYRGRSTIRRMKIRMELTEALVTEDITPFERERRWRPRSGVKVPDVGSARLHL